MSERISIHRAQAHAVANLLEEASYPDGTAQHSANQWVEGLRSLAGPVEPTSYAARVTIGVEEWARESASNSWWCLFSTQNERPGVSHLWHELLDRSEALDLELKISPDGR